MIDDELESEDEFDDLMRRAGHGGAEARDRAIAEYRKRFPAFVKRGQREFLNRVATDLREVIERGEQSAAEAKRRAEHSNWRP